MPIPPHSGSLLRVLALCTLAAAWPTAAVGQWRQASAFAAPAELDSGRDRRELRAGEIGDLPDDGFEGRDWPDAVGTDAAGHTPSPNSQPPLADTHPSSVLRDGRSRGWIDITPSTYADGPAMGPPAEPFDLRIARRFRQASVQERRTFRTIADIAGFAAVPGTFLIAGAFYGVGELDDRPALRDAGLHAGESLALAIGATGAGKMVAGRARPYQSPEDPHDFAWGRGVQGDRYQSFPSFHTAAAFAMGTVMVAEASREQIGSAAVVAPAIYTTAVLSGISRMYQEKHWASDVIVGALVGTLSGVVVNLYNAP